MTKTTLIASITTTTVAVGVLAGLLVGCSATDTTTAPVGESSWAPTTDTTAEPGLETPATIAVPVAGETVTSDEQVAAAEAAGLAVFKVFDADGNYVSSIVFDKAAPLPEQVKAAIAAPVSAAFAAAMATGISGDTATAAQAGAVSASEQKAVSVASSARRQTGKNIVIVSASYGALDGVNYGTYWLASSAESQIRDSAGATAEAVVAKAQAWIATQPSPETYEIVVAG